MSALDLYRMRKVLTLLEAIVDPEGECLETHLAEMMVDVWRITEEQRWALVKATAEEELAKAFKLEVIGLEKGKYNEKDESAQRHANASASSQNTSIDATAFAMPIWSRIFRVGWLLWP